MPGWFQALNFQTHALSVGGDGTEEEEGAMLWVPGGLGCLLRKFKNIYKRLSPIEIVREPSTGDLRICLRGPGLYTGVSAYRIINNPAKIKIYGKIFAIGAQPDKSTSCLGGFQTGNRVFVFHFASCSILIYSVCIVGLAEILRCARAVQNTGGFDTLTLWPF